MVVVTALTCGICGDELFSRTIRDCRECSCGNLVVQSGFISPEVIPKNGVDSYTVKTITLKNLTDEDLYIDWNLRIDLFGHKTSYVK